MKKIILNISIVLFLLAGFANSQTTLVNIGTDTLSSNFPFTTYWMDGRTDMLFLKSELNAAGANAGFFTGVAFYINHVDTLTMNGFNVKFQNTSDTSLTGFGSGWDIAFSGTYKVLDTGWQVIYFTSPYGWNGINNLVMEICFNNNRYTWFSTVRSSVKTGRTYGVYQDLSNGDGCTELTSGNLQQRRPNVRLYYTPLTGVTNNNSTPVKYSLAQNYPNPFNPETRINYSIQKDGFVSIKVFDMLGREAATLVSDYKKAGNYITEFNASGLPSGVYYCKMISGDFSDVKKMFLIK